MPQTPKPKKATHRKPKKVIHRKMKKATLNKPKTATSPESNGTILQEIIQHKKSEVRRRRAAESLSAIRRRAARQSAPRDFAAALQNAQQQSRLPVIAEIKRKSPSTGILRKPFSPPQIAKHYARGGAACLSVLTDTAYFGGAVAHLQSARRVCDLPVLRKDFMIDEWQIWESRAMGADAILLLASVLSVAEMASMARLAADLRMAVLLEVHNAYEAKAALEAATTANIGRRALMGINNRDLASFAVSLEVSVRLLPRFKRAGYLTVSESGIGNAADIQRLRSAGAHGFLIGGALLKAPNPGAALAALFD